MRTKGIILLCLTAVFNLSATMPDAGWSIVVSGRGSKAEQYFDNIAAKLLQKGLKHLTGAELKIVIGEKPAGKAVFVGRHADPVNFENRHWQGRFRTDAAGNWYFAGSYRPIFHMQQHLNHRFHEAGVIRCAALFLREYAGLRVPLPNPRYHVFTTRKDINFPENFIINYNTPDITYCNGRNTGDPVYDLINGYLPGVWYFTYGGHSHPVAVPLSVYGSHPDFFILTAKNTRWRGLQYCISNPGFQELVYNEMCRKADAGYEWVQLAQTDAFSLCRCKKCQEYGDTRDAGEKIWILHRALAERFHKERPGRKVVILCYHPNLNPPKTFNEFPPNVIIELCKYTEESFQDWKKVKVPGGFVVYVYNWGTYHTEGFSPRFTPDQAVKQLKLFRKHNIKGIFRCGFGDLPGLEGPSYYAYGQALVAPETTAEQAVDEFCRLSLPQAPAALKHFYEKLQEIMEKTMSAEETEFQWHRIFCKRMPSGYRNHLLYARRYNEKNLGELETLLRKCEKAAPGNTFPLVIRRELDLVRYTAEMSAAYLKYLEFPDESNLKALEKAVQARSDYLHSLPVVKNHYASTAGLSIFNQKAPEFVLSGGTSSGRFVYPLTWPWEKLMQHKIVPGARTVKADGKKHLLLPALMEKWEMDVRFNVKKKEKGILITLTGVAPKKNCSDMFFISLPEYRFFFRSGGKEGVTRTGGLSRFLPVENPVSGEKFAPRQLEKSIQVRRIGVDCYTVFFPWRFLPGGTMPKPGESVSFNISFRRLNGQRSLLLTFEPDLKYLNERSTWMSGRGKLFF